MREWAQRMALAGALVSAGCASLVGGQPTPPNAIVLDVPEVSQDQAHECGLASIAALCEYYGYSVPLGVSERLQARAQEQSGLSGVEIRDALQAGGLSARIVAGTLDHSDAGVYRQIDLGRPPLVMAERQGDVLHATLLVGYDPDSGGVLHLDPVRGTVWESAADFTAAWEPAGRFALIAAPPASFDAEEASLLRDLESVASAALGQSLAGDLALHDVTISDNDLMTVLIVLGIIVLIAILV
jgi:ABC-type bacteriocin/lantibiotic exporter with double-glycine peptidase domain